MNFSITSFTSAPAVAPAMGNGHAGGFTLDLPPLPGSARDLALRGQPLPEVVAGSAAIPPAPVQTASSITSTTTRAASGGIALDLPPLPGSQRDLAQRQAVPTGAQFAQTASVQAEPLVLDLPPLPGSARDLAARQTGQPQVVSQTASFQTGAGMVANASPVSDLLSSPGQSVITSRVASEAAPRMQVAALPQAHGAAAAGLPALALEIPPLPGLVPSGAEARPSSEQMLAYAHDQAEQTEPGFTFGDMVDIINPLQHIPIVSTAYRSMTDDEIRPVARIAGGGLFGGFIGAAGGLLNVGVEGETGKDVGEHVWDGLFGSGNATAQQAQQRMVATSRTLDMAEYGELQLALTPLPGSARELQAASLNGLPTEPSPASDLPSSLAASAQATVSYPVATPVIPLSAPAIDPLVEASSPAAARFSTSGNCSIRLCSA